MYRPTLILQPTHSSSADILRCFAEGKPISSGQRHFLEINQKQLSSSMFDPVLKYFLDTSKKHPRKYHTSFLQPHEDFNLNTIHQFKQRLPLLFQQGNSHVVLQLTQKQFQQFKDLNIQELIFWHGNQLLTGAPFFPGGLPPVIFFQWGNYFGVVKYVILADEKTLDANLLVYFEDMQDRDLNHCVADYNHKLTNELTTQNELFYENKLDQSPLNRFLIKTPVLDFYSR